MKTKFLISAFLISILSCTVEVSTEPNPTESNPTESNPTETELAVLNQTIDEFNTAFETCDIDKLNQLTTVNYSHTNSSNATINKEAWMDYLNKRKSQLTSGQLKVTKYLFEERQVSIYNNSAWVTGVILMDGVMDATAFSRKIRVSHLWVKDGEQWKRAGFHDTRID